MNKNINNRRKQKMAIILNNRNKRIPKVNLPKVFVVKDGTYNINLVIKD